MQTLSLHLLPPYSKKPNKKDYKNLITKERFHRSFFLPPLFIASFLKNPIETNFAQIISKKPSSRSSLNFGNLYLLRKTKKNQFFFCNLTLKHSPKVRSTSKRIAFLN